MSRTVVLVHGNFVSRRSWDGWVERFAARGYTCVPIAYPGRDRPNDQLRRSPDVALLRSLTLPQVVEHHVRAIRALAEKPIIIGHSFGGLITQLLIQRDLGVAGVAIDSVPPFGVPGLEWSFFRSTWPAINPFAGTKPYLMSFPHFQYAFANGMDGEAQRAGWERDIVPESRRLARGAKPGEGAVT